MTQKPPRNSRHASFPPDFRPEAPSSLCSPWVLGAMGLLCLTSPMAAWPQVAGGTLPVLKGVVSGQAVVNATAPGAPTRQMTIDQTSQRAILDWKSFNIGSAAEVLFRQPGSLASTLNRIYDANPSVIQGKLSSTGPVVGGKPTAGGQVILINQNGILFDRGAQVNTQSLVASTLNISNERYLSGALTSGGLTSPAFAGGYDDNGNTIEGSLPSGSIRLGTGGPAGAAAPRIQANAGGSVVLVAPHIDNQGGVITAPDGQVILAAGSKAYLALNSNETDTTLRGFVVEVEAAPGGAGVNLSNLIRNAGDISADRGNVTFVALAINQAGRVSANTAVQSNGSIFLKARTLDRVSGTVTFAQGSVTEVQPDTSDKATMPDSADYTARRGTIEVDARTIASSGVIRAAGGRVQLRAADAAEPSAARVYLDKGSETSVAGAWAEVPYANNLQTFRVTSNELKNSPDQKTGVLRDAQVTVDLRQPSAILDLSGYIASQPRMVAEKAATGGELTINSSGSVVQRDGATLDASGGGYLYGPGSANTSRLLGADGKIYDISTAPEVRNYVALLDSFTRQDARWGQTQTFDSPLGRAGAPEPGYAQGLGGGSVVISAPSGVVLDGAMKGGVTVGLRQLTRAPRGASLALGIFDTGLPSDQQPLLIGGINIVGRARDTLGAAFDAGTELADAQKSAFDLSAEAIFGAARTTARGLEESGFASVELNSSSRIAIASDVRIEAPVGSSLTLRAPQVDIAGDIHLPAGQMTMPPASAAPLITTGLGAPQTQLTVRNGATVSTAGAWINNSNLDGSFVGDAIPSSRAPASGTSAVAATGGGAISLTAQSVILERGALLDVSGGGSIDRNNRVSGGAGGSLTIANGLTSESTSDWLRAELRGFGVSAGGQLNLTTPRAVIETGGNSGALPADTTRIEPQLFNGLGFATVRVNAPQGLSVTDGTTIRAQQKNLLVDPLIARNLPTGGSLGDIAQATTLPDSTRGAVNVTLTATDAVTGRGVIDVGPGAAIIADPRAKITLTASDGMTVAGRLVAPGGDVTLTLNAPALTGAPSLKLESTAQLSTAGTFVQRPNDAGLVQGTVVAGGTVNIEARNTGVVLDAGSSIDVGGIRRVLDISGDGQGAPSTATPFDAPAGAVIVKSQGAAVLDSTFSGRRPSNTSAGGSFALELVAPDTPVVVRPDARRIVIGAGSTPTIPETGFVDAALSTDRLTAGGFDKLRLLAEDRIEFRGDKTLEFSRGIRLDAPLLEVTGGGRVELKGANVALGQSLGPRVVNGGAFIPDPLGASPVLPTHAGDGSLTVRGGTADLFGNITIDGVKQTTIEAAHDVRFIGRPTQVVLNTGGLGPIVQTGSLNTQGNVAFAATQVYPTTRTSYTVSVKDSVASALVPDGQVRIAGNDNAPGEVYSAGGRLVIEADHIVQAGRVLAPLGEVDLRAGRSLELSAGSLTSVSANGLVIPYGSTSAGVSWSYNDGASPANTVTNVTTAGKRVELSGTTVDVKSGARVDLRGGGDVQAVEFVPGNGGDTDVTLRDITFAILPKARLSGKPFDSDINALKDVGFGFGTAKLDTSIYDSLTIGSGGTVPAGDYVLLPARYALLPEAYLVQLQTGSAFTNLKLGQTTALADGKTVVAAYRTATGTSVRESQSVGVVVRVGAAVRLESDYTLTRSQFFADAADRERLAPPPLPQDGGRLAISRATALNLEGRVDTDATKGSDGVAGRGAEIDISGPRIAIVDQVGSTSVDADYLQLAGSSLSALGGSVLIGGTRSDAAAGVTIATEADRIVVINSAQGTARVPELMLTAKDTIDIRAGASLSGSGTSVGATPAKLNAESGGAFVRLSNAGQTTLDRGATIDSSRGQVLIGAGATLSADRAVLIDATKTTQSQGVIRSGGAGGAGGAISLASAQVSLGDVAGVVGLDQGLVLSNADLATFGALDSLTLKGYGGIDFYGSTALGSPALKQLTLEAAALRGQAGGSAGAAASSTVQAQTVTLSNASNLNGTGVNEAPGTLAISAERLVFGAGAKAISGWTGVKTSATGEIVGDGVGSLAVAADWTLEAQRLRGTPGSNQVWSARNSALVGADAFKPMTVNAAAPGSTLPPDTALGARLELAGQRVALNTTVQALSGRVTIAAHGSAPGDDVNLGSSARIDVRGAAKDFNGTTAIADGGAVTLTAAQQTGKVVIAPGAVVDVSAAVAGGNAGSLRISAAGLAATGELRGTAGAQARSGSVDLDLGHFASESDFSALNARLNQGGFAEARSLRLRNGPIEVLAADSIAARDVLLAADSGQIRVAGTVGRGTQDRAAAIGLFGGTGVTLTAGGVVNAAGSAPDADGGKVHIATASGALNFDDGAIVDVRKGSRGDRGSVTLTVPRDSSNALEANRFEGTVLSQRAATDRAATVVIEAQRSYTVGAALSAADISGFEADHLAFIEGTPAPAVTGRLKADGGVPAVAVLRGATELRTTGDLALNQAMNLTTQGWLAGGQPGTLNVRAAGNLTVSAAIGSPNDNILAGETWNLRAVAGADLNAANPLATLGPDQLGADKGDLLLSGAAAKLRTGTGNIDLAAARDFRIDNVRGVVYTSGRIGEADIDTAGNNRWAVDGGDISLTVGRDASGPASAAGDLWVTDWLRRPRVSQAVFNNLQPTDWWAYRPNFQQGLGTLAGGDIDIAAEHDVKNLSAALPTTGRTFRDSEGQRRVDVQGGGDLRVAAGNDVSGGAYLVGRGIGSVDAAGDVGQGRGTQLYLMGASSGDVPAQGTFDASAGGALRIQSINNPTIVAQFNVPGSTGPSFGNAGLLSSFFTYSENSLARLRADGGDLTMDSAIARPARTLGTNPILAAQTSSLSAAFPASLEAVSFNGSIVNSPTNANLIVTYPSASAHVQVLANDSIPLLRLTGSDRDPATVSTPTSVQAAGGTLRALTSLLSGNSLLVTGPQPRIVQRGVDLPFIFDIQALTGTISGANATGQQASLGLPARSRVRAGLDIVGADLTLQNLDSSDVSEVRADQGDIRAPRALEIRGPGRLLLQAGRNIDLGFSRVRIGDSFPGGLLATGNSSNPNLPTADSARITVVAGARGVVDLAKLDSAYQEIIAINSTSGLALDFYSQLNAEANSDKVLGANTIADLARQDSAYQTYVTLDTKAPRLLANYQNALRTAQLPLGAVADAVAAKALYQLLNTETDVQRLVSAGSVAALAGAGGQAYSAYIALDQKYPRLFADYVQRRSKGALPTTVTPIVFSDALAAVMGEVIKPQDVAPGGIASFNTSIQTYGGSDIDLLAPGGNIVVGLTTPSTGTTVGVLTNSGGAIRSVAAGNFDINQGKVLTAQGGDILILSAQGSIDAGRGAKTSLSTPPPTRTPIFQEVDGQQVVVGFLFTIPASASGSGIQTLTSDPDGTGPRTSPAAGNVYLFAPAGTIDAGEAGIRSSGNIVIAAQTVLNASNISASGSSAGVPVAVSGSLASSVATSGGNTASGSKAAEEASNAAANAAKAAASAVVAKPSILTVEVLGFGEKNCKEQDKDCFAK